MYEGYKSKTFLNQQETISIVSFNENYEACKEIFTSIKESQKSEHASYQDQMQNLPSGLDSLQSDFKILISLLKERGFKDFGLEGELRTAIHQVENSSYSFDRVTMLMLRRHEKDFFSS